MVNLFNLPQSERVFMQDCYDKLKPAKGLTSKTISAGSFIAGMLERVEFEFHPMISPKRFLAELGDDKKRVSNEIREYFLDGKWKTFTHPVSKFIEKETHYLIANEKHYSWDEKNNCFQGLSHEDYIKYKEKVTEAFILRARYFFNLNQSWRPKAGCLIPNLRGSLDKYLIN